MKINYTFANGETSDVEVREEIGNLILDSRREESNQDRKERYHCYSLDAAEYEGEDYADGSTPETELFLQLENQRIKEAFEQLSEVQRRRLLMLAEGVSLREIARREGKDIKTIRESILEVIDTMQKLSGADRDKFAGIPTGFNYLDTVLTGLGRSDLIILAARPGMGKTAFALNIALNAAKSSGKDVVVFQL